MLKKRVYVALNGSMEEEVAGELSRAGVMPIRFGRRSDLARNVAEDPPDALVLEPNADLRSWDPGALLSLELPPVPTLMMLSPAMLSRRDEVLRSGVADLVFRPSDARDVSERVLSLLGLAPSVGSRWLVNHPVLLEVSGEDAMGRTVELSRQRALVLLNAPVPIGVVARLTLTSLLGPPLIVYARTLFCRNASEPSQGASLKGEPRKGNQRARLLLGLRLLALSSAESMALGHLCRVGRSTTPEGRITPPPLADARNADAERVVVTLGATRKVEALRDRSANPERQTASSLQASAGAASIETGFADDSSDSLQLVDFWDSPIAGVGERQTSAPPHPFSRPRRSSPHFEALFAGPGEPPRLVDSMPEDPTSGRSSDDDWPDPTPLGRMPVVAVPAGTSVGADVQ